MMMRSSLLGHASSGGIFATSVPLKRISRRMISSRGRSGGGGWARHKPAKRVRRPAKDATAEKTATKKTPIASAGGHSQYRSQRYSSPLSSYGMFYRHADKGVLPLYGKHAEGNAWLGLGALTFANLGVFYLWNMDDSVAHQDFMLRNFTINLTNLREGRLWTLITCSFSHQDLGHIGGNMFALWLFGFKTYRVLSTGIVTGAPGFFGLYLVGSLACGTAHCAHNVATGRTGPPLTATDRMVVTERQRRGEDLPKEWMDFIKRQDMPSLGASGSVMSTVAVSMCLFPRDKILVARAGYISIPYVALFYFASDFLGIFASGGNVDHVGHIGGAVAGFAYASYIWRTFGKRAGPLPLVAWWAKNMKWKV